MAKTHKPVTEKLPKELTDNYNIENYDIIVPTLETSDPQPTYNASIKCAEGCVVAYPHSNPARKIHIFASELNETAIQKIIAGDPILENFTWGATTGNWTVLNHRLK